MKLIWKRGIFVIALIILLHLLGGLLFYYNIGDLGVVDSSPSLKSSVSLIVGTFLTAILLFFYLILDLLTYRHFPIYSVFWMFFFSLIQIGIVICISLLIFKSKNELKKTI